MSYCLLQNGRFGTTLTRQEHLSLALSMLQRVTREALVCKTSFMIFGLGGKVYHINAVHLIIGHRRSVFDMIAINLLHTADLGISKILVANLLRYAARRQKRGRLLDRMPAQLQAVPSIAGLTFRNSRTF